MIRHTCLFLRVSLLIHSTSVAQEFLRGILLKHLGVQTAPAVAFSELVPQQFTWTLLGNPVGALPQSVQLNFGSVYLVLYFLFHEKKGTT